MAKITNAQVLAGLAAAGLGLDLIGDWYNEGKMPNLSNWELQRAVYDNAANNYYNSLDSLLAGWNSNTPLNTNLSMTDVGGYTTGLRIGSIGSSALKGAGLGASIGTLFGGPVGAAIGAGIGVAGGAIGGSISSAIHQNKSAKALAELNALNELSNYRQLLAFLLNADNLYSDDIRNKERYGLVSAYGGILPNEQIFTGDYTNGLTFINEGGTHEENPLGGVPMGMAPDDEPNLVEEGEVAWNNFRLDPASNAKYIFSDRIKVPGDKDMSFADAVKQLSKESEERPNDPISMRGLNDTLMLLAIELELLKAELEDNEFKNGGIHIAKSKRGTFTAAAKKRGMSVLEFASKVLSNKSKYSKAMVKKANFARNFGGHKHATDGIAWYDTADWSKYLDFGVLTLPEQVVTGENLYKPVGVQPYVPDVPTTIDFNTANRTMNDRQAAADYNFARNAFTLPRKLNPAKTVIDDFPIRYGDPEEEDILLPSFTQALARQKSPSMKLAGTNIAADLLPAKINLNTNKLSNYLEEIHDRIAKQHADDFGVRSLLRYAPVFASGILHFEDLFKLTNKEDYTNPNMIMRGVRNIRDISTPMIGHDIVYKPEDINLASAKQAANLNAVLDALINTSSGNAGVARASVANADYVTGTKLADLALAALLANNANKQNIVKYRTERDATNYKNALTADALNQDADYRRLMGLTNAAEMREGIYRYTRGAKNDNYNTYITNLGLLGLEETYKALINKYPWLRFDTSLNYIDTNYKEKRS